MIRFGCFAHSKIGSIRSLLLPNREFCNKISQNSYNSVINEIKQSINKLESEIEQQKKFRNRQTEKQMEEIVANFDDLKNNRQQFENKFASLMQEMEGESEEMKKAFNKFAGNLKIMRKKMQEEQQQEPEMKEAKAANLREQIEGNVNFVDMKNNKWDSEDCGSDLKISSGGLKVKHTGKYHGVNYVSAILPIPKFNLATQSIIAYFEVEILKTKKRPFPVILLGFCSKECGYLGYEENWIGIFNKNRIYIESSEVEFEENDYKYKYGYEYEDFDKGDVIGLGIINSQANGPLKCFSTCNGKLLGMVKLPAKFSHLQLFPTVSLLTVRDSIKANFGANEWLFNPQQLLE